MMICNDAARRRGFTLIEMLVFISVTGFFLMITTVWIGVTFQFSQKIRKQERSHRQLIRLESDFRTDIRSSRSAAVDEQNRLVLDQGDGRSITYSIVGTRLDVVREQPDLIRRDSYQLSEKSELVWDLSAAPEQVGLTVFRTLISEKHRSRLPASQQSPDSNRASEQRMELVVDLKVQATVNRWPLNQSDGGGK